MILEILGAAFLNQIMNDVLLDIAYAGGAVAVISLSLLSLYWVYQIFQSAELQNLEMAGSGFSSSRSDFIDDSELSDLKMENDELNGAEVQQSEFDSQRDDFIWESEVSDLRMEGDPVEMEQSEFDSQRDDFIWQDELDELRIENESLNRSDSPSFDDEPPLDAYTDSPEYSGLEEPEYA